MNRLIVKYGYPITVVILLIFAWVVYRRLSLGWSAMIPLAVTAIVVWALGAVAFIYLWPRLTINGFKRAILKHRLGGGWLDVREGPQVLHTPDMDGRYYSVQFTDPSTSANFAYVGKRTSGTAAGDVLLSGPGWKGTVPNGTQWRSGCGSNR